MPTSSNLKTREKSLRRDLLQAQFDLAQREQSVVVVIGGLPGAGKSELVHRLNEWLDPRFLATCALWMHSDEEEDRPYFWRFWRHMPPHGRITLFLDSWYTRSLYENAADELDPLALQTRLAQINAFERMLYDDGTLVVKLWLEVDRMTAQQRLAEDALRLAHLPASAERWSQDYEAATKAANAIVAGTDAAQAAWQRIPAQDADKRDIIAGETLLTLLTTQTPPVRAAVNHNSWFAGSEELQNNVLADVPLDAQLSKSDYATLLEAEQHKLQALAWRAHDERRSLIAVFEGWDAAGKGSAIRRVTAPMDPRLYRVVQSAAPSDEEQAHHYLWRYWRNLERSGRATLFDRSWYGRVLVERVEQFAAPQAWQRAYDEINQFEQQLQDHGCIVVKFWLHISPAEQLRRFQDRQNTPHKQHKITDYDWRNRARWADYESAVLDMVELTSTAAAPWTLVAGNDKRYARVQILQTLCAALEQGLSTQQ